MTSKTNIKNILSLERLGKSKRAKRIRKAQESAKRAKTETEDKKSSGMYFVVDEMDFGENTCIRQYIEHTMKILDETGKTNKDIPKKKINIMLRNKMYNHKTMDQINGAYWNDLMKKCRVSTDNKYLPNSLLYWKSFDDILIVRYNFFRRSNFRL